MATPAAQKRVLIAEDDRSIALLLKKLVESCDLQAEVAHDGHEAMESMRAQPPNLLLLDLIMPIMSGEQVLDSMQADEVLRGVPVIVVTTKGEADTLPYRCCVLQKPFSPAEAKQIVRQMLNLS